MSPEHLLAISAQTVESIQEVQEPADLYSLAILLWELWQGVRPFATAGSADSWSDSVRRQLESRSEPLLDPLRLDTASERVLEKTLRETLQPDPGSIRQWCRIGRAIAIGAAPTGRPLVRPARRDLAGKAGQHVTA